MDDFTNKIKKIIIPRIKNIKNPKILEFGVQKGRSTIEFLKYCEKNDGHLYSFDIEDCSKVSQSKNWSFHQSRDDNFEFIKKIIPENIDLIFLDTIHEADHVKKIFYEYFDRLKINGFFIIDDISHLPYTKTNIRDNFYCEINNKETFDKILEIYNNNQDNFDLEFSFISSGLAIITKKQNDINKIKPIILRENRIKNILRKIWKKIKKN
jgi:predicted O-methyltransferase YrrM